MLACGFAIGCGRVSFDVTADGGAPSDGVTDGATVDLPANAMTMTFGERATADVQNVTADTFISNEAGEPTLNNGGAEDLRSEQDVDERILLFFDLGAIPPTATVLTAVVTLDITQTHPSATWELHRVLQSWTEGTLDGAPGVANFSQRTAGAAWDSLGCGEPGSAGPTFKTVANIPLGELRIFLDPALVQDWIATPAGNVGMIFYNTFGESVRFASSEHPTQASRPLLTITFVP